MDSIKVGAKIYKIHWTMEAWNELILRQKDAYGMLGYTISEENMIWIVPGLSVGETKDTLLHEVLHAIFSQTYPGKKHDEERIVHSITPWLLLVLTENPQLYEFLVESGSTGTSGHMDYVKAGKGTLSWENGDG